METYNAQRHVHLLVHLPFRIHLAQLDGLYYVTSRHIRNKGGSSQPVVRMRYDYMITGA